MDRALEDRRNKAEKKNKDSLKERRKKAREETTLLQNTSYRAKHLFIF